METEIQRNREAVFRVFTQFFLGNQGYQKAYELMDTQLK